MSVVEVEKDFDEYALTVTSEYRADPARIWELWADPRLLERWWGPPGYPATVTDHDLAPGGAVAYYMTGPDGEKYHGGWRVISVEPPVHLEFEDFFSDDNGKEITDMPVSKSIVSIVEVEPGVTRMVIESRYESVDAMKKVLEMGVEEGIRQAVNQIDAILAA